MIRIAQIMGKMGNGGVDAVVMNYYRHIDRNKIQFDFIIDGDSPLPRKIEEEIVQLGGKIYRIAPYQNIKKNMQDMKNIFLKNKYKIVHSHLTTMNVFSLFMAKRCNVSVRICHAHSVAVKGEIKRNILKYILRPFSKLYATHWMACSDYVGKWMYGKKALKKNKVIIINNAINTNKFKFDPEVRKQIRNELNIEDKYVVGHVGRFVNVKNHSYLIDIFYELHRKRKDSVLVLIGEGKCFDDVRKKVKRLGLDNDVLFLGTKNNIYAYYQAFDVFVFPSLNEGLGIVAIEAQMSGLKVVCSDYVPSEVKFTNNVKYISLKELPEVWANNILKFADVRDTNEIKSDCFDIEIQTKKLEKKYYDFLFSESQV